MVGAHTGAIGQGGATLGFHGQVDDLAERALREDANQAICQQPHDQEEDCGSDPHGCADHVEKCIRAESECNPKMMKKS